MKPIKSFLWNEYKLFPIKSGFKNIKRKGHVKIKKERTAKLNWQVEHPAVLDFINFLVSLSLYLFMYLLFFNKQ